jgi:hypothetical protein
MAELITIDKLREGCAEFKKHEGRDSMYRVATYLVEQFWGKQREMSDALGVLLLTWNQAFYRYGLLDFEVLDQCLVENWQAIEAFRPRNILSYSPVDDVPITGLYDRLHDALQISDGKMKGRKSPVAVVKTLHLLAPAFFPLWDARIAKKYGCQYDYIPFIRKMKDIVVVLTPMVDISIEGRTLLKMIDEYNYVKYTKEWI